MSAMKREPEWMLALSPQGLPTFLRKPVPTWGWRRGALNDIDFDDIYYYIKPMEGQAKDWDMVPESIKATYEKLGIPQAGAQVPGRRTAQYESEVVTTATARTSRLASCSATWIPRPRVSRDRPKYFGTIIPPTTTSSPRSTRRCGRVAPSSTCRRGCIVDQPLQAYFRINAENMGQFERTLIIVDEGAYCHYVEGVFCADVLERFTALGGGRDRRQGGWSLPIHDHPELVEQRIQPRHQACGGLSQRHDGVDRRQPRLQAHHEIPGGVADGGGRHGERLSIAFAGKGQHQDAGAKIVHAAPNTTSLITSKSISEGRRPRRIRGRQGGERRGAREVLRPLRRSLSSSTTRAVPIRTRTWRSRRPMPRSGTRPRVQGGDDQLFYLMSRGLTEQQATAMIVAGFIEPIVRELPMEYARQLNRLIELQMEGSVGVRRRLAPTDGRPQIADSRNVICHPPAIRVPQVTSLSFAIMDPDHVHLQGIPPHQCVVVQHAEGLTDADALRQSGFNTNFASTGSLVTWSQTGSISFDALGADRTSFHRHGPLLRAGVRPHQRGWAPGGGSRLLRSARSLDETEVRSRRHQAAPTRRSWPRRLPDRRWETVLHGPPGVDVPPTYDIYAGQTDDPPVCRGSQTRLSLEEAASFQPPAQTFSSARARHVLAFEVDDLAECLVAWALGGCAI